MTTHPLAQRIQHEAYHIVYKQAIVIGLCVLITWIGWGTHHALSFFFGGSVYLLPTFAFVWSVFRFSKAEQMPLFLAFFFMGEAVKLIVSSILFLLVVKYLPFSLLSVLAGFICAIGAFWVACLWQYTKRGKAM